MPHPMFPAEMCMVPGMMNPMNPMEVNGPEEVMYPWEVTSPVEVMKPVEVMLPGKVTNPVEVMNHEEVMSHEMTNPEWTFTESDHENEMEEVEVDAPGLEG